MIPSDTNSMSWDQLMIMGDRILSPRTTHTKVTKDSHFVLKSGIKGSQKFRYLAFSFTNLTFLILSIVLLVT